MSFIDTLTRLRWLASLYHLSTWSYINKWFYLEFRKPRFKKVNLTTDKMLVKKPRHNPGCHFQSLCYESFYRMYRTDWNIIKHLTEHEPKLHIEIVVATQQQMLDGNFSKEHKLLSLHVDTIVLIPMKIKNELQL